MPNTNSVLFMGHNTNIELQELKRIEQAARTCYKSEGKITKDGKSAEKMFHMLVDRKHFSMLRFGERSVVMDLEGWLEVKTVLEKYNQLQYWRWTNVPYSFLREEMRHDSNGKRVYIARAVTSNLQGWMNLATILAHEFESLGSSAKGHPISYKENTIASVIVTVMEVFKGWPNMYKVISKKLEVLKEYDFPFVMPYPVHDIDINAIKKFPFYRNLLRYCFRVVTDRGITHEIVRHTTLSYAQESTRYVSSSNGDPKNIVFVPEHLSNHPAFQDKDNPYSFWSVMDTCLKYYNHWKTEESRFSLSNSDARNFLPHCLKSEIVISGYLDKSEVSSDLNAGFSHFIDMRLDKAAHKGIQTVAKEISKHIGYPSSIDEGKGNMTGD